MIERLSGSGGSVVGFAVTGTVTPADYEALVPAVTAVANEFGRVQLLCDLTGFRSEQPAAWVSDLRFGREFHGVITKLAMVGDSRILAVLTRLSAPFYAKQARHFTDVDQAWDWLREQ